MKKNLILARILRKTQTEEEKIMWYMLRNRRFEGLKFNRQYPIGDYIVDFICKERILIIELDGGQHNEIENIEYDNKRTEFLNSLGYKVIRFWNNDIKTNIDGVYIEIMKAAGIDGDKY